MLVKLKQLSVSAKVIHTANTIKLEKYVGKDNVAKFSIFIQSPEIPNGYIRTDYLYTLKEAKEELNRLTALASVPLNILENSQTIIVSVA